VIAQSIQHWATGWTIGVIEFDSRRGLGIFLFFTASRTALGPTQPPIQWVPGALSLGVKRPGREADHSPPSSAEVKNAWSYTSTPPYAFMAWCLVKHRDNFTFTRLLWNPLSPIPCVTFRNKLIFYGEVSGPRLTPRRRTTLCRLPAAAYLTYSHLLSKPEGRRFLRPQPEDTPWRGDITGKITP
jgi:hypothetical protein